MSVVEESWRAGCVLCGFIILASAVSFAELLKSGVDCLSVCLSVLVKWHHSSFKENKLSSQSQGSRNTSLIYQSFQIYMPQFCSLLCADIFIGKVKQFLCLSTMPGRLKWGLEAKLHAFFCLVWALWHRLAFLIFTFSQAAHSLGKQRFETQETIHQQ